MTLVKLLVDHMLECELNVEHATGGHCRPTFHN